MNQPLTPDERLALEKLIGDGQEAPRGPTPPHSTQDPPLKCDELDVLLRKYSGATTAAPPQGGKEVAEVPATAEQLLLIIQQRLAKISSGELTAYLQANVEVSPVTARTVSHDQFVQSIEEGSSLFIIEGKAVEWTLLLEATPLLANLMVRHLLGAEEVEPSERIAIDRPLSSVEEALLLGVFDRLTRCLRESWAPLAQIDFQIVKVENSPQELVDREDHLLTRIDFEVSIGSECATFCLCIPDESVASLLPTPTPGKDAAEKSSADRRPEGSNLGILSETTVDVAAILATIPVSLLDLLELKPGDVIQTERHKDDPVLLDVEGKAAFTGKARTHEDRLVFEVEEATERDSGGAGGGESSRKLDREPS